MEYCRARPNAAIAFSSSCYFPIALAAGSMPKQKSNAEIQVADGAGGLRQVPDLRFEAGAWPIELVVPAKDAEAWMAHLRAEAEERGWHLSGLSQLDATENSGTLCVVSANGPSPPTLDIVWERPRGKGLRLRARPSGDPALSPDVAQNFIVSIGARLRTRKVLLSHQRAVLTYNGLPWRGELWLDGDHRLGAPSRYPDSLLGPQLLIVDSMIEGIGQHGVTANFERRVHELRVFLGFVLGLRIEVSKFERRWVCDVDTTGRLTDCKLRDTGYVELTPELGFPKRWCGRAVERRDVTRPGLGPFGIRTDMDEQWVPRDIEGLWRGFLALSPAKRDHLLRAGNAFLIAQSMWPDQRTAYAAFLVVACEALKPSGKRHDRMNVYDVVASLMDEKRGAASSSIISSPPENSQRART